MKAYLNLKPKLSVPVTILILVTSLWSKEKSIHKTTEHGKQCCK